VNSNHRGDKAIDIASELWIGQFNIVGGHVQEQGPWVTSSQPQSSGEPIRLYVVTEPANEISEQYTEQLGEAVGTLFAREEYSLTGNLTRALRGAHDHLKEWNRTSVPEERVGAGVSILALREDVGYIAQVGPSFALHGDGARSRRIQPADSSAAQSVGLSEDFRPSLTRVELGLGESVLLCGSTLASKMPAEQSAALLGMDPEEALGQVYVMLKEERNLGAILISHVAAGAPHAPSHAPETYEQAGDPSRPDIIDDTVYDAPDEGRTAPVEPPSRDPFAR
jgi:hypothetical protein